MLKHVQWGHVKSIYVFSICPISLRPAQGFFSTCISFVFLFTAAFSLSFQITSSSMVAWEYTTGMTKQKTASIRGLTMPGVLGQIMASKCSKCGEKVLDDDIPLVARKASEKYVYKIRENGGYGNEGCTGTVRLIPTDKTHRYIRPSTKNLESPPPFRGRGEADTYFLSSLKGRSWRSARRSKEWNAWNAAARSWSTILDGLSRTQPV